MGYGFRLHYVGYKIPKIPVKYIEDKPIVSDNLKDIAKKIKKDWIFGDSIYRLMYYNYYFNSEGAFAKIEWHDSNVSGIEFINSTKEDLERTVKSFGLPYNEKKVRTS